MKRKTGYNSTFAIGGALCSAVSVVFTENSVLRMNIYAEKPAYRKCAVIASASFCRHTFSCFLICLPNQKPTNKTGINPKKKTANNGLIM
ncbi:MAG: hypothetical protein EBR94_07010 [Bacteroidetes bacterium]|nr:hypothetical protein [Bacteroidota bacterium]